MGYPVAIDSHGKASVDEGFVRWLRRFCWCSW